jgi:hypothetical protein
MKASEKSIRWIWVLNCAALGYTFAIGAFALRTITYFPAYVIETLVPMVNFTTLAPVDPGLGVALGLWGPVNAVLYGLIGLFVAEKQIDRMETST